MNNKYIYKYLNARVLLQLFIICFSIFSINTVVYAQTNQSNSFELNSKTIKNPDGFNTIKDLDYLKSIANSNFTKLIMIVPLKYSADNNNDTTKMTKDDYLSILTGAFKLSTISKFDPNFKDVKVINENGKTYFTGKTIAVNEDDKVYVNVAVLNLTSLHQLVIVSVLSVYNYDDKLFDNIINNIYNAE